MDDDHEEEESGESSETAPLDESGEVSPSTSQRVQAGRTLVLRSGDLRRYRENAKIPQAVLAAMINVSPTTLGQWESGAARPDSEVLVRLLEILQRHTTEVRMSDRGDFPLA
jgi:DNA-binding transcriptional regulator YiaG